MHVLTRPVRSARPLGTLTRARPAIWALALILVTSACSGDATGPGVENEKETVDLAPEIVSLNVAEESTVYLRGVLAASVTDPEDNVTSVVVDWGDGETVTISSAFDDISRTHDYAEHGSYTVVVSALDAGGNQVSRESALTLANAPGACLDVKLVGVCGQVHPNFQGADIVLSALDNELYTFSLSTTKNNVEIFVPVAGFVGQAKVVADANFSKTKGDSSVRLRVFACTLFSICTSEVSDKRWTW